MINWGVMLRVWGVKIVVECGDTRRVLGGFQGKSCDFGTQKHVCTGL